MSAGNGDLDLGPTVTDGDVISFVGDNRGSASMGLPRHASARARGAIGARNGALWSIASTRDFTPPAVYGRFPAGFLKWATRVLRCPADEVLHLCSGAISSGITVDRRREAQPMVLADARRLPFRDGWARGVLIDPPYSVEYARNLYGVDYPRPIALLREACRVAAPGARIGILHYLVPGSVPGITIERVYGITTGAQYRIRAFSVFLRDGHGLPEEVPA